MALPLGSLLKLVKPFVGTAVSKVIGFITGLDKTKLLILLGLLAAGGVILGVRKYQALQQENVVLRLKTLADSALNDSTRARLALETANKDSLAGLLDAAKKLHGTLVAGVRVHVPAKKTEQTHNQLPTATHPDSTRTATFHDSTFAGVVEGTITAPPCCAPLGIRYSLMQPAFNPAVGFVEVAGKMVAVVSWQGQEARLDAPFAKPQPKRSKPIGGFAEVRYQPFTKRVELAGGLRVNLLFQSQLTGGLDSHGDLFVGMRKEF